MKNFLLTLFIFGSTSIFVLTVLKLALPAQIMQEGLALLIVIILITINFSYKNLFNSLTKWFLIFLITIFVQLLVIETGNFISPFFILFYFLALGIGLVFDLNSSIIFLACSFWTIIGSILLDPQSRLILQHDPASAILYGVSFLAITPLTQLFVNKYKFKEKIVQMMSNQLEVGNSIIEELNELIFVTDKNAVILSVNDAAVQTLRLSKQELVNHSLFDVIFLKDETGKRITKETLMLTTLLAENKTQHLEHLSLLAASVLNFKQVGMHIKPVLGLTGALDHISFIINTTSQTVSNPHKGLEEAVARYEGMVEEMKKNLITTQSSDLQKFILLTHTEKDILVARTLEDHGIEEKKVLVDLAALCKHAVNAEETFARGFDVRLQFHINNFSEKDVQHLSAPGFPIELERFTGPFFTAPCEFKYLNIAIQKFIDVAILLSAHEKDSLVSTTIEREGEDALLIKILAKTSSFTETERLDLFIQYYGSLARKTKLNRGSGLEGYLAKKIVDLLTIPFEWDINEEEQQISFLIRINKAQKSFS